MCFHNKCKFGIDYFPSHVKLIFIYYFIFILSMPKAKKVTKKKAAKKTVKKTVRKTTKSKAKPKKKKTAKKSR